MSESARYREWAAPLALRRHVACLWEVRIPAGAPAHVDRVIPDGCVDVIWANGRLFIAGPDTMSHEVPAAPTGAHLMGLRFRPGQAPAALGLPAHVLVDQRPDARDVLGRERAERLEAGLRREGGEALAAHAMRWLEQADPADRLVTRAIERLAVPGSLPHLPKELGVSDRQLRRRFVEAVGYGPKLFERVSRLRRFVALAERAGPGRLGALAQEAGYADQPHLSRDVKELAGCTPAALVGYPVTAG